jgi:GAF domain-containing protein
VYLPEASGVSSNEGARTNSADAALERLGRLSWRDQPLEDLLQQVAELAKSAMPGSPETSIFVQHEDGRITVVSTGDLALRLDETQYSTGQGPCLHAATTGELTEIPDIRTETRWPDYARRAVEEQSLSSLSVPLAIDEHISGALNIYSRQAHAFDEGSRSAATRFGPYAAVALSNMYAYDSARDLAMNLEAALRSRAVIDQAKGILIERYRLTPDQAFQRLAAASMATQMKVRDIADHLVATGELPETPRRR